METSYDLIIIGGGQAGIPLAQDLAAMGKQIVLAERKYLGGSCVNFGCTPTKAAIASARLAHMSRRGGDFGIRIPTVDVDFGAVIQRAQKIAPQATAWSRSVGWESGWKISSPSGRSRHHF